MENYYDVIVEEKHFGCVRILASDYNSAKKKVAEKIKSGEIEKPKMTGFDEIPYDKWQVFTVSPVIKRPMYTILCGHNDLGNRSYYAIECQDGSVCDVCGDCFGAYDLQLLTEKEVEEYYKDQGITERPTEYVSRFATMTDLLRFLFGLDKLPTITKGE